jgi:hypothetical protein
MFNFNARNKFKKEALKLVASTLAAADVQVRCDTEKHHSSSRLSVVKRVL